jgi:hypothetical protein
VIQSIIVFNVYLVLLIIPSAEGVFVSLILISFFTNSATMG